MANYLAGNRDNCLNDAGVQQIRAQHEKTACVLIRKQMCPCEGITQKLPLCTSKLAFPADMATELIMGGGRGLWKGERWAPQLTHRHQASRTRQQHAQQYLPYGASTAPI